jgi:selenocysteine-specific elongation factor
MAGLAELVLDTPLHLADNDMLIVRDASAQATLAGARVLERAPPERAKRHAERLAYLASLEAKMADDDAVLDFASQYRPQALEAFAWARQLPRPALLALPALQALKPVGSPEPAWVYAPETWQGLKASLVARLSQLHAERPDELGASRARLRRLALPRERAEAVDLAIDELLADRLLANTRGWLHLPDHSLTFTAADEALWQRIAALLEAQEEARWVRDLAKQLDVAEDQVRELMKKADRLGYVVAIVPDRYYPRAAIEQMAATVKRLAGSQGYVETAAWRDAIGVGRKLAIQILEFFDRQGFTRRLGDRHWLRDAGLY